MKLSGLCCPCLMIAMPLLTAAKPAIPIPMQAPVEELGQMLAAATLGQGCTAEVVRNNEEATRFVLNFKIHKGTTSIIGTMALDGANDTFRWSLQKGLNGLGASPYWRLRLSRTGFPEPVVDGDIASWDWDASGSDGKAEIFQITVADHTSTSGWTTMDCTPRPRQLDSTDPVD